MNSVTLGPATLPPRKASSAGSPSKSLPVSGWLSGHAKLLSSNKLDLFRRCAELDGIVRLRLYWVALHIVTAPDLVAEVLVDKADAFEKGRALKLAKVTFGNGLVTSEGETWKRQRRLIAPLLSGRTVAGYAAAMKLAISKKLSTFRSGETRDLHAEMVDVSMAIACETLFGIDARRLQEPVRETAHALQRWHADFERWCLPWPHLLPTTWNARYRLAHRPLERVVQELIAEARQAPGRPGLIGKLLAARDDEGHPLHERQIRDEIVTMLLAGHDTTATTMAFALYELAHRPDVQETIRLDADAGATLDRVIQEVLRLYPAVHMIDRIATRDTTIGGRSIRKGDSLLVSLMAMQRDPRLHASPDQFQPERWQRDAKARHGTCPFSAGPRTCTGQAMAMQELRTVVTEVLRRFRLSPVGPREVRLIPQVTLLPAPGSTVVRLFATGDAAEGTA